MLAAAAAIMCAPPAGAAVGVAAMERFDELPYFKEGTACHQFSSHDRTGGNDDGYWGTYSALRQWNGKWVVFDVIGPGCIYNIWFTGDIPGKGNIQFYFDDEATPRINMPLSQFFAGSTSPFLSPLAGAEVAGGYYCYVPIPFAQRLIVALTQYSTPFYHHFTYHRFASAEGVQTYTGSEDMSTVLDMWTHCGTDPKPTAGNQTLSGTISVGPGQAATLANLTGAGSIASIRFAGSPAALEAAWLRMYWDGELSASVSVPFRDFFGAGLVSVDVSALPVGQTAGGEFYCYFPMPYWSSARIVIQNTGGSTISNLWYEVQYKTTPYGDEAGYFRTQYRYEYPTTFQRDYTILSTTGRGHYVGVVHTMAGRGGPGRTYLEGDERVYVDDGLSPCLYGTGTEDYYLGGWYFSGGETFSRPCHGAPVQFADTVAHTVAYRFHLTDCIPYQSSILVGIEHGGVNEVTGDYSSVAYYYGMDEPALDLTDTLDVGDAASEAAHGYTVSGQTWSGSRTYYYEGDDDDVPITDDGRAFVGQSQFTVAVDSYNEGVRLRRRADYAVGDQRATVWVDGQLVGTWYTAGNNAHKQWLDSDFEIPAAYTQGKDSIAVTIQFVSGASNWNEFHYSAYSHRPWLVATASPPDLLEQGWNLISVPREPGDPSPPVVFAGVPIDARLHRYQSGSGYVTYLDGDPLGFGGVNNEQGYWLYLDGPATVSYTGQPVRGQKRIVLASPGWHLIGVPAFEPVSLDALYLSYQTATFHFSTAVRQGWLDRRLYGYDPARRGYFACGAEVWDDADYLAPWYGYWVCSYVDNLAITFP